MRKLIVVGLCSVHDAVNEDQGQPKRQNPYRDPRQDEKGPNSFEHRTVPRAVTVRGGRVVD
jgi:predicted RNA-binding protein with PUA-like domain